ITISYGERITTEPRSRRRSSAISGIDPRLDSDDLAHRGAWIAQDVEADLQHERDMRAHRRREVKRLERRLQHARAGIRDAALESRVRLRLGDRQRLRVFLPEGAHRRFHRTET